MCYKCRTACMIHVYILHMHCMCRTCVLHICLLHMYFYICNTPKTPQMYYRCSTTVRVLPQPLYVGHTMLCAILPLTSKQCSGFITDYLCSYIALPAKNCSCGKYESIVHAAAIPYWIC